MSWGLNERKRMQGSDGRMSQTEGTASAMNLVGRLLGYLWNTKKILMTEVIEYVVSVTNIGKQLGERFQLESGSFQKISKS